MLVIIIFILFILFLIFITNRNNNNNKIKEYFDESIKEQKTKKPYLWVYWENKKGSNIPDYIKLCRQTLLKHASKSFNIVELNEKNIYDYLPELRDKEKKLGLDKLIIAHKVDYYRILLLYKYGGLYMDSDIVLLRDPYEIVEKLTDYDFVGFGCTGEICHNGYSEPSNWCLASRPRGKLMGRVLKHLEQKLENTHNYNPQSYHDLGSSPRSYHDLGKFVIWQEIKNLGPDYKYYHYPSNIDGTRDKNGHWVTDERLFSDKEIDYEFPDKLLFVVLYNSEMNDLSKKTTEELISGNSNYSKFIRLSFGLNQ